MNKEIDNVFSNKLMCQVNAIQGMKNAGYCQLDSDNFSLSDQQKYDLSLIQRHFDTLARDPYGEN